MKELLGFFPDSRIIRMKRIGEELFFMVDATFYSNFSPHKYLHVHKQYADSYMNQTQGMKLSKDNGNQTRYGNLLLHHSAEPPDER